jgi:hypothetical protein
MERRMSEESKSLASGVFSAEVSSLSPSPC